MNYKLKSITEQYLHISHSQLWAYLNCSLRYYFQYVLGQPRERTSINLVFGSALHKALERYYADLMAGKSAPGLPLLQELFTEYVAAETNAPDIPIVYKKDMADADQTLDMGTRMLETLYLQLPPPEDHIVSGVEVPLAARLVTPDGTPMDMVVTGILDPDDPVSLFNDRKRLCRSNRSPGVPLSHVQEAEDPQAGSIDHLPEQRPDNPTDQDAQRSIIRN